MRTENLITGGQAAHVLACRLGTNRNWEGVLNDFRQRRGNFACTPLLPVARVLRGPRAATPVYRPRDVLRFIDDVRTLYGKERPFPFELTAYAIADEEAGEYWFTQVATPASAIKPTP